MTAQEIAALTFGASIKDSSGAAFTVTLTRPLAGFPTRPDGLIELAQAGGRISVFNYDDPCFYRFQPAAPPAVTGVSPSSFTTNTGNQPATVTGTGFTPSSIVRVDGIPAPSYAYVSSTSMTCTIPTAGRTGPSLVSVQNPGPVNSNNFSVTIT